MFIDINGLKINYEVAGTGNNVVLLHGWGANIKSFEPVHQNLQQWFTTYSIDLPGFGKSDQPPCPWGVKEYAAAIDNFFSTLNINQPIIIGHSFGGRIAIYLAAQNNVQKMILVDSAGIKPKRSLKYFLKVYTYKAFKNLLKLPGLNRNKDELLNNLKKKFGSADYQNVSGVMQQTLIKVVNEDLRHLMPQIKASTLLIWGEKDTATPVSDGQLMEKLIPDAGLVILKNVGHFSYLEKLGDFLAIINNFLDKEKIRRKK